LGRVEKGTRSKREKRVRGKEEREREKEGEGMKGGKKGRREAMPPVHISGYVTVEQFYAA